MGQPDSFTGSSTDCSNIATHQRVLVCSVPKSGTYLLSSILDKLGLEDTHLHISKNEASAYRDGTLADYRNHPEEFRLEFSLDQSLARIQPGQYGVSHLPCDAQTRRSCQDVRVLFLHRDLRDCAISMMRFLADTGRDQSANAEWMQTEDGPERFVAFLHAYQWFFPQWVKPVLGWSQRPNALPVCFETLLGDFGQSDQHQTLQKISAHLDIDTKNVDFEAILADALHARTLTWSGSRTRREKYWSTEADKLFAQFGGASLNTKLGYKQPQRPINVIDRIRAKYGLRGLTTRHALLRRIGR